jgi:hypothetical protein
MPLPFIYRTPGYTFACDSRRASQVEQADCPGNCGSIFLQLRSSTMRDFFATAQRLESQTLLQAQRGKERLL